ncbi:MAG TPA: polysaccharide biosynthesis/export family protein [Gemmatimonadales bacterium]|nr:polysaccharide biosynthesis/export family protein [Gemmatimonadales bacterium]
MTPARHAIATAALLLCIPFHSTRGQAPNGVDATQASPPLALGATRMRLEARAQQLEQVALATTKSSATRDSAAREAAVIRQRLSEGDFKVGDQILLQVEGEPTLSDTFTVGLGSTLTLPAVGEVSLAGVLRSEVQDYLTRRLGQNLRDPVVKATAYVRLSVVGAVARPGYYAVPAQALLSDALMAAGGPAPTAKLQDMKIERSGKTILEKKALQHAIAAGMTIDDAGLIAGDQYSIPAGATTGTRETIGFIALLLTIPITVYSLTQIWKK